MKPQYKHLKLIIEVPTQEAWDKVTEFFGLDWKGTGKWSVEKSDTCVRLWTGTNLYSSKEFYTTNHIDYELLSYPQFCERFLNQDNGLEYDTNIQLAAIFEGIDELFAPFTNGKIYPEATVLRNKIEQKLMEVTRNSEPLPFGEDKPSDMVTIYDRIPMVNEDVLIGE